MPKRLRGRIRKLPRWDELAPAALLLASVSAGCLAGGFLAADAGDGGDALADYLRSYLSLLARGGATLPSFPSALWEMLRWPLLIFALGFTAFAAAAVPAAFFARGLLLGYAVSAFALAFGRSGLLAALCVFALPLFCVLPALFALALAPQRWRVRPDGGGAARYAKCVPWLAWLLAAALAQWAVMPLLVRKACLFLNLE